MTPTSTWREDALCAQMDGDDDALDHIVCICNENLAFCGKDMTDAGPSRMLDGTEGQCVVCIDLAPEHMKQCSL